MTRFTTLARKLSAPGVVVVNMIPRPAPYNEISYRKIFAAINRYATEALASRKASRRSRES